MRTSSEPARAQRRHLPHGAVNIGRVGIGHRLHDDRRAAAHDDAADIHGDGLVAHAWRRRVDSNFLIHRTPF